jgi:hypothetical protein
MGERAFGIAKIHHQIYAKLIMEMDCGIALGASKDFPAYGSRLTVQGGKILHDYSL